MIHAFGCTTVLPPKAKFVDELQYKIQTTAATKIKSNMYERSIIYLITKQPALNDSTKCGHLKGCPLIKM